jgi:aspartate racemase
VHYPRQCDPGGYGALNGVEVVTPPGQSLDAVHDAYVTLASRATCSEDQRQCFFNAGRSMVEEPGADVVLLAGTDLAIAFDGFDAGFPTFDCADAHVRAIFAKAIQRDPTP